MIRDIDLTPPEFVENREPRCPVILLLDTSRSMAGAPIDQLNAGLAGLIGDLRADPLAALRVELAIIAFGDRPRLVSPFRTADDLDTPVLKAGGQTPMGQALHLGLEAVAECKTLYRRLGVPYYRPWIFLITDGTPTDGALYKTAAARLHEAEAEGKLSFYVVAVEGADLSTLGRIAPPHRPPYRLDSLKFRELFQWLSASVRRASSGRITPGGEPMPPTASWSGRG
ncbi:MAG: hypothetical protein VR70_00700 [Rhodospirillaceae bacterium BRH_c57]|nr:MAG: hypothetical protein VR70_00700 [Rhodospirillaceae bacterium BRH_c57]